MRIFRGPGALRPDLRGASAAMGNFDGVHRGHRAVIEAARAARPGAPLGVVTFDPHPRRFFQPDLEPFALTDFETKARRLSIVGVDVLYALPFDRALASMSPATFCEEILVGALGLDHVAVGADFCFGARRAGDGATLRAEGARLGFGVTLAPLAAEGDEVISSTAIRAALREGRPEEAARMLGHWHRIEGPVEHGEKRGRTLGYPTANIALGDLALPRFGVYAVKVDILDGPHRGTRGGVASLGVRPMFGRNRPNLEVHLFDFSGDLYGARLSVALVAWLRGEEVFDGLDALIAQMGADSEAARARLAAA
jgi:riboflavin kinase / FMN adenylyltransferase